MTTEAKKIRVLYILLLFIFPGTATAYECPKAIAVTADDVLSAKALKILSDVYEKLNCDINVIYLPGRRGISYFNSEQISGELFRLKLVEDAYKVGFVRSNFPLFKISNAAWVNPTLEHINLLPLGYVVGIAWQEHFIKQDNSHLDLSHRKIKLYTYEDIYAAYDNKIIGSFLSSSQSVKIANATKKYNPVPELHLEIESKAVYHYLNEKYAPFMFVFSEYISKENPFKSLE